MGGAGLSPAAPCGPADEDEVGESMEVEVQRLPGEVCLLPGREAALWQHLGLHAQTEVRTQETQG